MNPHSNRPEAPPARAREGKRPDGGDASSAEARAILEVALDAIVSMDHQGLVTEFNPAAEQMFRIARADAVGKPLADVMIPPALREAHRNGLRRYLATGEGPLIGKRIESTAHRTDGSEFPVELAICRIPGSDPPAFLGFIRDLTEARRAAEALRAAEERSLRLEAESAARAGRERAEARSRDAELERDRLIAMLEVTPDFVGFASAKSAQILYVNEAGRAMCGIPADADITALRIADVHPAWAYRRLKEEILPMTARDGFWSGEIPFADRAGREIPAHMIVMSHRGPDGEVEIYSTISRDISERKRAEEVERRLVREQTARAVAEDAVLARDDFVAMAGHELRTPLAALMMQAQGMLRAHRAGQPMDFSDRLDKLVRSGRRLENLIDQLLDVSKITAGSLRLEPETFDLGELVREVVARFADEGLKARCPISLGGDAKLDGCWDRLRIDQVLTNLLANAIKYGRGRPIEVELARSGGTAVVRVTDHGIGIDHAHQERIFARFERAVPSHEYGGFGLGLWISRRIVEASCGTIEVDSQPGRGSTFSFRLPLPV